MPRAGGFPQEYSSFLGRRAELAAARAALGSTRLLTLVGSGGVGKTRFAVRLAQSVSRVYADGAWFIDLSDVAAGFVSDEVCRVLELQSRSPDEYEALSRYFTSKRGLLVLDNCEHLVDESARLVRRILDDCRGMTVLATSRAALRISAESVFVVQPLVTSSEGRGVTPPAVALFLDRCATVLPRPTPADLKAIAEICRRLDGLPLAIELAAARVTVLTPVQMLDRLAEPLALLAAGDRDAPDRQRTLRATIAWSYQLCTEVERTMWRRMSVFAGGWDLESAEWMTAGLPGGDSALDVAQSLLEKSIITRRQSGGVAYYDMLETVWMFGLEISSAEEHQAARLLHRDWNLHRLAALEADWYGPNQAYWLSLTRRDLPNIRAALEFCIDDGDGARAATLLMTAWRVVWQAHGRSAEFGRWAARVLDLDVPPTPEISQLMTLQGGLDVVRGDADRGLARLALAAELAERFGDRFSIAWVYDMRASMARDPEQALADFEVSLAVQGGTNLIPARANCEEKVSLAHDRVGHADIAARMREALVDRGIEAGDSYETAFLLVGAGNHAAGRNEFGNATMLMRQSLSLTQNLDDPIGVGVVEELLASVALRLQDYRRAATLLGTTHFVPNPAGALASAYPGSVSIRAEIESEARRMLGAQTYDSAFARGRSLTFAEGIAYALDAPLPVRSASRPGATGVLTARESQVASLVGQGLTDKDIADRLVISRRTAEGHVANSLAKLGFTSRTQLAAWTAQESGDPRPSSVQP
ncbi:ATP-binding protein [Diaminobutyricibacter sp. McL0608]|uniref:ATP-binding protein n=1 Tax=Leifsonia sp. McL0608 TaxID=3143537 RepID=UPI0031F2FB41